MSPIYSWEPATVPIENFLDVETLPSDGNDDLLDPEGLDRFPEAQRPRIRSTLGATTVGSIVITVKEEDGTETVASIPAQETEFDPRDPANAPVAERPGRGDRP